MHSRAIQPDGKSNKGRKTDPDKSPATTSLPPLQRLIAPQNAHGIAHPDIASPAPERRRRNAILQRLHATFDTTADVRRKLSELVDARRKRCCQRRRRRRRCR